MTLSVSEIEAIVAGGGDVDEVLRRVVALLHENAGYAWAGIFFVEEGALALGPSAGEPNEAARTKVPVRWQGERIAELAVDGAAAEDREHLERIAELVSAHCLVGWDTAGEPWEP
jgi:hypothetical protein